MDEASISKIDWSKCCLCQLEKNNEILISPSNSFKRKQDYAGYSKIATNVPLFHALNDMPIAFNPSRLDEGEGIEATLIRNQAKYHNSCRLLFTNTKLERARKRQVVQSTSEATGEPRSKRRTTSGIPKVECFFCEEEDVPSNLSEGMTGKLNHRVNRCARNLNDGKLLAKLGEMLLL